jgi:hypothetical protein
MLQVTTGGEIAIRLLQQAGVPLGPGLSNQEIWDIESTHSFVFDVDHRDMLRRGTPQGDGWFDWRSSTKADIETRLAWVPDGVYWDVEHNGFWPKPWGRRPKTAVLRARKAGLKLARVPRLIPLFSNRFIAEGPSEGSAPVFSVIQSDVIYYGDNLPSYIARELDVPKEYRTGVNRHIRFWSDLANNDPRYVDWPDGTPRAFWNRTFDGVPALPPLTDSGEIKEWKSYRVRDAADAQELLDRIKRERES